MDRRVIRVASMRVWVGRQHGSRHEWSYLLHTPGAPRAWWAYQKPKG
jgi:hypothetical protein